LKWNEVPKKEMDLWREKKLPKSEMKSSHID